jgi:hypothetical protein
MSQEKTSIARKDIEELHSLYVSASETLGKCCLIHLKILQDGKSDYTALSEASSTKMVSVMEYVCEIRDACQDILSFPDGFEKLTNAEKAEYIEKKYFDLLKQKESK